MTYQIQVAHETIEGDPFYVARVRELPDFVEYSDTAEGARQSMLIAIEMAQDVAREEARSLPAPIKWR